MPVVVLEVFADIGCPFAYVGLLRARRRRDELGCQDEPIRVRAWPLELVNGEPQDPATVAEHIADLREQIQPELFAGFDPEHFPTTTLPALSLVARGYELSDTTGEAVSFALRRALFEERMEISSKEVLTDIGRRVGITAPNLDDFQLVVDEWHEGQRRGVEGSPHFYCRGMASFCPSLDISRDDRGRLQLRPNSARLDRFLDLCFLGAGADQRNQA